jgi:hypothetical protein
MRSHLVCPLFDYDSNRACRRLSVAADCSRPVPGLRRTSHVWFHFFSNNASCALQSLFETAGLTLTRETVQKRFPSELCTVRMYALQPRPPGV